MTCNAECTMCFSRHPNQPIEDDLIVDGVQVKKIVVPNSGTYLAQHSHEYPHLTVIAGGSVDVWKNEHEYYGRFENGAVFEIAAYQKHRFQTLSDRTIILCVHNISRSGAIAVAEENSLPGLV